MISAFLPLAKLVFTHKSAGHMESMYEDGNEIPLPGNETEKPCSVKFNVRIPKSLHCKLDEIAEREGVSLNHCLVSILSLAVGREEAVKIRRYRKHPVS
jgi:predicted HicB family RNase H-like nuclease